MTQLKSEAAQTRAAMDESTPDVPPGTLRAWKWPGPGIIAVAAAGPAAVAVAVARAAGIGSAAMWLAAGGVAAITAAYLAVVGFKLAMVFCGAAMADAENSGHPPRSLPDEALPLYTVLVPLVDSSGVAAAIDPVVEAIAALDYPAERLEVLLLADADSQPAAVPVNFEFVTVRSTSRAAACAVGLGRARGELCAVYDPGQRPDRGQLLAAVAAFRELPAWVVCVRPEVRCESPGTNWLSECAAADRAVSSALFLRGLDRFRLPLPVGGSSCHFRTEALRRLDPWGSQDRTDGGDLGMLIARRGWSVRMITSVTDEAPDLGFGRWLRRRTAAIRDDHKTGVAHSRSLYRLWRDLGPVRFASMRLTMAGSAFAALVNPIFWVIMASWLVVGSAQMTRVFPLPELVTVLAALLLGNLITAYSLMVGCMEQGLFAAVRTMLLGPAYWALNSVAAYRAMFAARRPVPATQAVPRVAAS